MKTRIATGLLAASLFPAMPACEVAKNPTTIEEAMSRAPGYSDPEERYLIGVGDQLEVVFFHTPELNRLVPVRPDGFISLPIAHEVQAAGRTTEQLRTELLGHFSRELEDPEIAVIVTTFIAQKVHVGGEVDAPGVYPIEGTMTVFDSLMAAGVITRTARLDEVLVIRRDVRNKSYMVIPVNMKRVIDGTDPMQNIVLAPYDAVFVPTSVIADVNTFVDLYIRQNIPVDFGIRFNTVNLF